MPSRVLDLARTSRRSLLLTLAAVLSLSVLPLPLAAQPDPLPSWNDGPAAAGDPRPRRRHYHRRRPRLRRARRPDRGLRTSDGTTWTEQPLYGQGLFALDRLAAMAPDHPEWKTTEPFKAVLTGDHAAMAKFSEKDWLEIVAVTHAGMSTTDFATLVADWLPKSMNPVKKRPVTDLVYQPMLEAMAYLRASGFRTYIVTGGGQDFVAGSTPATSTASRPSRWWAPPSSPNT